MSERELSDEDRELARRLMEQMWGVDITRVVQVRLEDGSILTMPGISEDYEWVKGHSTTLSNGDVVVVAPHWRKRAGR